MKTPLLKSDYQKIDGEEGFILGTRAWRETSLLAEIFSRRFGKQTLIARSARKAGSELRGLLHPFARTRLSWFGRPDFLTLHAVKWLGGQNQPRGIALLSAWYINELVYKLLPYNDPHPRLFAAYATAMDALAAGFALPVTLRKFEWSLLGELGLAPDLAGGGDNPEILPGNYYLICPESNPVLSPAATSLAQNHTPPAGGLTVRGQTLLDINAGNYQRPATREEARLLLQFLLRGHLPRNRLITSNILSQIAKAHGNT